jgi:hypothetical protein
MSNAPSQPRKSDWLYQVFRSFAMWMTHLVAGIALLVVMLGLVPNFDEILQAKEWPIPVLTLLTIVESRWFVDYLWIMSPIVAILDLAFLLLLNIAGGRWRFLAGLWHNVLLVGVLLNISFAYLSTEIVYRTMLNPEAEPFIPEDDVDVPGNVDE